MGDRTLKLTSLRKAMGRQMTKSLEAPQFQLETEVDCTKLIEYRNSVNYRPTFTTILTKVVADTLVHYPELNSSWGTDCLILHDEVNIGIAIDTNRGLLVPVMRDVANKSLLEIHNLMEEIKTRRELGKFSLDELTGGTFTISNLGPYNITSFKAVVNVPEVGILAISKIINMPVVRNDQIVSTNIMRICLSADHRVVDGAYCSRFLTELVALLESL